jgi:XTP/dITP diphosphohydrolase
VKLYCATSNPGKVREYRELAGGIDLELLPGMVKIAPCEETGATFEENAILKAVYYGAHTAGLLFAEDSGLEVDALGGAPGVYSARYAGEGAGDAANNRLLLERLCGVADRTARYHCVIALARDGRLVRTFHGAVEGLIVDQPRGSGGFGYDPYFYFPPLEQTFAELSAEAKNAHSHRFAAFSKLVEFLRQGDGSDLR